MYHVVESYIMALSFKSDCPFCKIIHDRLDYYGIHENDKAMAFLDLNPVSDGHALVIPKVHAETLTDLNDTFLSDLFACVKETVQAIEASLRPEGINILQSNGEAAGQEIMHAHVHVIPRYSNDGFSLEFEGEELDGDHAEHVIQKITAELPHHQ
jgi:histidine triad (HIT) family protein